MALRQMVGKPSNIFRFQSRPEGLWGLPGGHQEDISRTAKLVLGPSWAIVYCATNKDERKKDSERPKGQNTKLRTTLKREHDFPFAKPHQNHQISRRCSYEATILIFMKSIEASLTPNLERFENESLINTTRTHLGPIFNQNMVSGNLRDTLPGGMRGACGRVIGGDE